MHATYTTANGRLKIEFEAETNKKLVEVLASIQEVTEESTCGCCKSDRIRFDVREFDGNHYYKLFCEACGATLDFGQHKTGGTLFVKRFEKDDNERRVPLPNRGWYRWSERQQAEQPKSDPTKTSKPAAEDPHAKAVAAMNIAQNAANLDGWYKWRMEQPNTTVQQDAEAKQVYFKNKERLTRALPAGKKAS